MRIYVSSIVTAFSLTAAFAACGGDSLSLTDALNKSAELSCKKAYECMATYPTNTGSTFSSTYGASEAECVTQYKAFAALGAQQYQASIDAGRVVYNASDAQKCIDASSAQTCGQFWGTESFSAAACATAFKGTVADGGACTLDEDCTSAASECNTAKVCAPA